MDAYQLLCHCHHLDLFADPVLETHSTLRPASAQVISLILFRSMKEEVFMTCLTLAASYDMGEWQVYMTHLQWLLTDSR